MEAVVVGEVVRAHVQGAQPRVVGQCKRYRAILHSEPYASADLGAASDVTAKSMWSEAAPVSPVTPISPQLLSAVITPAHRAAIS